MSPARTILEKNSFEEIVKNIQNVSLFEDVRAFPDALEKLAGYMREIEFTKGDQIITEGAIGSEVFFLISGQVSVYKVTNDGEQFIVVALNGERHPFFGEASILDSEARSATIVADTHCRCIVLDRQDFEKFSIEHPEWALPIFRRIASTVMSRLRKVNKEFALLYNALINEIRSD